ncbi:hypothetical protein pipiens_018113, partial [Culex pipiens pipiens]
MKSFAVGRFCLGVSLLVVALLLTSTASSQAFTNPNYYELGDPCSAVLKSGKRRAGNCRLAADCKSLGPGNAYQFNLWDSTCFFTVTDPVLC